MSTLSNGLLQGDITGLRFLSKTYMQSFIGSLRNANMDAAMPLEYNQRVLSIKQAAARTQQVQRR